MNIQPDLEQLFNLYNTWFGEQFNLALSNCSLAQLDANPVIEIDEELWFSKPLELIDAATGRVLFKGRPDQWQREESEIGSILEWAYAAAALCDEVLPETVIQKLRANPAVIRQLVPQLLASEWEQIQAEFEMPESIALARLIEAVAPELTTSDLKAMLDRLMQTQLPDELVTTAFKAALKQHRDAAMPLIAGRLQAVLTAGQLISGPNEQLMIYLAEIGSHGHSSNDFAVMRDAFRRAEDKSLAAICLSDFNDPRGIAVMRTWLDNHPQTDRATRLEIAAAIKRLGGEVY